VSARKHFQQKSKELKNRQKRMGYCRAAFQYESCESKKANFTKILDFSFFFIFYGSVLGKFHKVRAASA